MKKLLALLLLTNLLASAQELVPDRGNLDSLNLPAGAALEPLNWPNTSWLWLLTVNGMQGLVDSRKGIVLPPRFTSIDYIDTKINAEYPVSHVAGTIEKKIGFYTADGKELVAPQYDSYSIVGSAEIGRFIMVTKQIDDDNQRMGIIDLKGNLLVSAVYSSMDPLDGWPDIYYKLGTPNDRVGVMKNFQTIIVPAVYSDVYIQNINGKDFVMAQNDNEQLGVFDGQGKVVVPVGQFAGDISEDLNTVDGEQAYFEVRANKKYGYASSSRGIFIKPEYTSIESIIIDIDIYFQVEKGKRYGVVNAIGKLIVEPKYNLIDIVSVANAGYIIVKAKGRYGIVSSTGAEIVPVVYSWIEPSNGEPNLFTLRRKGEEYVLNRELHVIKVTLDE
jgi:WG containing repeat